MFSSVLIANRGEIACRIMRTARRLGLRTIAVYSQADAGALHVRQADDAIAIGPAPASESYLRGARIIEAALASGAQCIHPGYGFLSENAEFAEACASAGLVFVGPPPAAIRAMGLKDEAKALMEKAGVPVVPGFHGARQEPDFLRQKAYETGYPVLIKAVAGGGGKGMRRVDRQKDFDAALESARREALGAFGDDRVLIERCVANPRHIEIQVFADAHGNAVHLFERDCSLQRRHQKVMEEAPAPGMSEDLRAAMGEAAVAAARAAGYQGAGTVEFIADGSRGLSADGFFFMEMNTRLQVEHPVTEAITGLDLVEWQLRVAAGERLPLAQDQLAINGHAIEARLYAEDPDNGFLPSTGTIEALELPAGSGIRVDAGVGEGDAVTPYYDPMIAKVIATGASRTEALDRLQDALLATILAGPRTNLRLLAAIAGHRDFRGERFDTGFIDQNLDDLLKASPQEPIAMAALGALRLIERDMEAAVPRPGPALPWAASDAWQLGAPRVTGIDILADGVPHRFAIEWGSGRPALALAGGHENWPELDATLVDAGEGVFVLARGRQVHVRRPDYAGADLEDADDVQVLRAPMHGKVLAVDVTPGQRVGRGDRLAVVEAMKMEHSLTALRAGIVGAVLVKAGDQVAEGLRLLTVEPATD